MKALTTIMIVMSLALASTAKAELVPYEVPTTDANLEPWSHFKIDVQCDHIHGKRVITYNYPKELTGTDQQIRLERDSENSKTYRGDKGEMKCGAESCAVQIKNLTFNKLALKVHLNQISSTREEFEARFQLALLNFGGEPGGIIHENPNEYCHDQ